ncbi:MAG: MerR family transcriptional regulator [Chloroflexi bacterium]|nr:MerR family transcriptional regulator [Chloroflexota bacterium]
MSFGRDEPVFAIGIVARRVGVHQQTLRNYERWGLVAPNRSGGGTRYYSVRDIERIEKIREWIDVLGINRAGVEVMTRLLRRIAELEQEVRDLKIDAVKSRPGPERLPGVGLEPDVEL